MDTGRGDATTLRTEQMGKDKSRGDGAAVVHMGMDRGRMVRCRLVGIRDEARYRGLVRVRRGHQRLVAASLLGRVHGAIGMPQQLGFLVAVVGVGGDADAGGNLQLLA